MSGSKRNVAASVAARLLNQARDSGDMGHADSVWPVPEAVAYPSLLDFPAARVLAYPREAVVAEKLEALVVLGDRNSRIKDFFDLDHIASRFAFDRATLGEAVRRTLARRATPIEGRMMLAGHNSMPTKCARRPGEGGDDAPPSLSPGSRVR